MGERNPRLNYKVQLVCLDCKAKFEVIRPDCSYELTKHAGVDHRYAVIMFPNQCPECRNLRLVTKEKEES